MSSTPSKPAAKPAPKPAPTVAKPAAAPAPKAPAPKPAAKKDEGERGHGRYISPDPAVKYTAYVSRKQVAKHGAPICPVTKKTMVLAK